MKKFEYEKLSFIESENSQYGKIRTVLTPPFVFSGLGIHDVGLQLLTKISGNGFVAAQIANVLSMTEEAVGWWLWHQSHLLRKPETAAKVLR
jgi:hypothetical protein